jgi:Protein of unknown function (DUF2752)
LITSALFSPDRPDNANFKCRLPAIAGIITLFVLPSDGLGIMICWFRLIFELPCPACGLTRGMSSLLHMEFYKSFMYHPLSILVLGYLFIMAWSGQADFLRKVISKKSVSLASFFSFKSMALLFITIWIVKLLAV